MKKASKGRLMVKVKVDILLFNINCLSLKYERPPYKEQETFCRTHETHSSSTH